MVLKSKQFDDVYFSADGGLAETRHVFFDGNDLPGRWGGRSTFVIAETGFGTGLNFLATWKLFEETAGADQRLEFMSVEKYPLSRGEIAGALEVWRDDIGDYLDRYLALYPIRVPGPHRINLTDRVALTVWFGDIADVLPEWQTPVDAWFLDGFTPAKNPEMWGGALYRHMARLSHGETTYATFTAAGDVRRGLGVAGFGVEKVKGFGRKRDMIKGRYMGPEGRSGVTVPKQVAIIGGGLAGCAAGCALHKGGAEVHLYEAGDRLAHGASGGKLGMINPKLTAKPTPHSDYYTAAYANVLRVLAQFDDIDFQVCGSRHLCTDEDKDRRFAGYIDNLGWHADHICRDGDDLIYPDGAVVSPEKLCRALAENISVHLNHRVEALGEVEADIIILANGYAVKKLIGDDLPIHSVRGQVSWVKPQPNIHQNMCFGGYITPQTPEGFHVLGSTFQPWETDIAIKDEDHKDNLQRYNNAMHASLAGEGIIGGWAALRTSSKDRFPIVGSLNDRLYISTAHGSHGIISSLMAAEIIKAQACGFPVPASAAVLQALSPGRFDKR